MYNIVYRDMNFWMPFSPFQKDIFEWLKLTLSHLHPKLMAFIRAFEIPYVYLDLVFTIHPFFVFSTFNAA